MVNFTKLAISSFSLFSLVAASALDKPSRAIKILPAISSATIEVQSVNYTVSTVHDGKLTLLTPVDASSLQSRGEFGLNFQYGELPGSNGPDDNECYNDASLFMTYDLPVGSKLMWNDGNLFNTLKAIADIIEPNQMLAYGYSTSDVNGNVVPCGNIIGTLGTADLGTGCTYLGSCSVDWNGNRGCNCLELI